MCVCVCVCVCVRFALVCCAFRVDFIKSLRLTNTVIIIIIINLSVPRHLCSTVPVIPCNLCCAVPV